MTVKTEAYLKMEQAAKETAEEQVADLPPDPMQSKEQKVAALQNLIMAEIDQIVQKLSNGFQLLINQECLADWTEEKKEDLNQRIEALTSKKVEDLKPTLQEELNISAEEIVKWFDIAMSLVEKQQLDDAIQAFQFLIMLNSRVHFFWVGLGMAKEKNYQLEEAAQAYYTALSMNVDDLRPALSCANCYRLLGDFDKATLVIEGAMELAEMMEDQEKFKEDALALKSVIIKGG